MIFAYLDPASGSLLLQAILGGLAGMAVAFRAWKGKWSTKRQIAEIVGDDASTVDETQLSTES